MILDIIDVLLLQRTLAATVPQQMLVLRLRNLLQRVLLVRHDGVAAAAAATNPAANPFAAAFAGPLFRSAKAYYERLRTASMSRARAHSLQWWSI
uniref:Putative secreted protein n=1 Tax=Anopheles darlingi TaxID=43151 RepID=A0A2M4D1E0_ANODA